MSSKCYLMKLDGEYMEVRCTTVYNFLYLKYCIITYIFKNSMPNTSEISNRSVHSPWFSPPVFLYLLFFLLINLLSLVPQLKTHNSLFNCIF